MKLKTIVARATCAGFASSGSARARSRTAIQQAQVRRQEPQFQLRRAKATSLNGLTGHATAPRSSRREDRLVRVGRDEHDRRRTSSP